MNGYTVVTATDGEEALQKIYQHQPALVVCDVRMPICDGFTLLGRVRQNPGLVTLPFLFMSGLGDVETVNRGRTLGADDYLTKPFAPSTLLLAVRARLERSDGIKHAHLVQAYMDSIHMLASAIESRDLLTGRHIERVAGSAHRMALAMGWPEQDVLDARQAAVLHDVGKLAIPDAILNKPGPLTEEEWQVMKTHPQKGVAILQPLCHIAIIHDGVRHHHEWFNGQGYPDGLAGNAIPPAGRMLAVADAYDAMTHERPYRACFTNHQAVACLRRGAGTQFDPLFVEVFLDVLAQP
jgi:putative two-component system response regulator